MIGFLRRLFTDMGSNYRTIEILVAGSFPLRVKLFMGMFHLYVLCLF